MSSIAVLTQKIIVQSPSQRIEVVSATKGDKGDKGDTGDIGPGVPAGGLTGQVLRKLSDDDFDTEWVYPYIIGETKWFNSLACLEPGFVVENGAEVSRTTFAELFDLIGTLHGPGNGTTTFNIPNSIDKFTQGKAEGGGSGGYTDIPIITHGHTASTGNDTPDHSHATNISHGHSRGGASTGSGLGGRNHAWYNVGGSWGAGADGGAPGGWWQYPEVQAGGGTPGSGGRSAFHTHPVTVNNATGGVSGAGRNIPPWTGKVPAVYTGVI